MQATTIKGIANAIMAGVKANYNPQNQAAELERLSELFLEMAASIEMHNIDPATGLPSSQQQSRYAAMLGDLGWLLDVNEKEKSDGSVGTGTAS